MSLVVADVSTHKIKISHQKRNIPLNSLPVKTSVLFPFTLKDVVKYWLCFPSFQSVISVKQTYV